MDKELEEIIMKQLVSETLSENEKVCFEEWYKNPSHQEYFRKLLKIRSGVMAYSVKDKVNRERAWNKVRPLRKISRARQVLKYAAILLLPLCVGFLLLTWEQEKVQTVYVEPIVKPGGKLAVLTLSTGKQVELVGNVSAMSEQGAEISNSTDKELVYKQIGDMAPVEEVYNTITIPRGGEYKLILADGTTVWLNSDSYIRFPVAFSGDKRQVELRGEAYFEVAKNVAKPFIVKISDYDIRVTGTQFNVRSYPGERVATTLVEGSVQLERGKEVQKMFPGQQALLVDSQLVMKEVDVTDVIGWREGTFSFKEVRLEEIINELARWYDFDVYYQNAEVKNYHFTAWFRRNASIEEVIEVLEKTKKIKMKLDGKTLIVQKKSIQ
ncbi:FecR family protein [Butyricimonas faecihominis]|jgi:putative anti-sigma factor|uniref:FecR family protein n=1 Tax=Butyricimonas faecihominis TaxID=1472416 RepID=UPI00266F21F0|nr:FecR family protein [Butyricimonas faecihominis]